MYDDEIWRDEKELEARRRHRLGASILKVWVLAAAGLTAAISLFFDIRVHMDIV